MRLILAHPSPLRRGRLSKRLASAGANVDASVADLSDLYDAVEHRVPAVVLVAATMTRAPEFEVMMSLFGALGVACILLTTPAEEDALAAPLLRDLPRLPEESDPGHLSALLSQARDQGRRIAPGRAQPAAPTTPRAVPASADSPPGARTAGPLILIGASTGGVDALLSVLSHFPPDCPPTLIVQHTGGTFVRSLIRLLDSQCRAIVRGAEDGASLRAGQVLLSPDGEAHLCLDPGAVPRARLVRRPPVSGHRPSVDALFRSAQPHADRVAAALLTGMGRDGAAGMLALRRAGARTLAQDEATSIVYGMPRVAWETGAAAECLPLDRIGPALLRPRDRRASAAEWGAA